MSNHRQLLLCCLLFLLVSCFSAPQLCIDPASTFLTIESVPLNSTLRLFLSNSYYEMVISDKLGRLNGPFDLPLGVSAPVTSDTKLLFLNSSCIYVCQTDHCLVVNNREQIVGLVRFSLQDRSTYGVTAFSIKEQVPSEQRLRPLLQKMLNKSSCTKRFTALGIAFTRRPLFNLLQYQDQIYLFDTKAVVTFDLQGMVTLSGHYYMYGEGRHCWVQQLNRGQRKSTTGALNCTSGPTKATVLSRCWAVRDRLGQSHKENASTEDASQYTSSTSSKTLKKIVLISVMVLIVLVLVVVVGSLHYCDDDKNRYVRNGGVGQVKAKLSTARTSFAMSKQQNQQPAT